MSYFNFPHARTYDSDLGWLIKALREYLDKVNELVELNSLKIADPINWNITTQYPRYTIVINSDGMGYISRIPVPEGIALTNTTYWLPIFDFSTFYDKVDDLTAALNAAVTTLQADIAAEAAAREAADQTLQNDLAAETTAREAADELLDIQWVTPQMFGAIADGNNDDTAAIQSAIDSGKYVYFPKGNYKTIDTIVLKKDSVLLGYGCITIEQDAATIVAAHSNVAVEMPAYQSASIKNLRIIRDPSFFGMQTGVKIETVDGFNLERVYCKGHSNGFLVDGSFFGNINYCIAARNGNDGFRFTNHAEITACQVQIVGCLSELNDGAGFTFLSNTEAMAVGVFRGNMSYANTSGGVRYLNANSNCNVVGIHIDDGFFGSDGIAAILIDGSSYPVTISDVYIEEVGVSPTGSTYSTPAANVGRAIVINGGSMPIMIAGSTFTNCAETAIGVTTENVSISGCAFKNLGVGQNVADAQKSGIIAANSAMIHGCVFTASKYGVYCSTTQKVVISNNTFDSTITTPVENPSSITVIRNNIGVNDN